MKSLLILMVLLSVATVSLCTRSEKKEQFVIVVKGNDEKNSTKVETKHTNTTRLDNISLDYKHDFQKINKTDDVAKKMYKFEAKDGRIYKRGKSISDEVTQESNYSHDNHVLSLPPTELKQQPHKETLLENLYGYQPKPYMAFKLCPVVLENVRTNTNDQGPVHYVPQPYLYQAPSQTGYRVPKNLVIRYKPFLEVVEDSAENLGSNPYHEVPPASYGPISGNGFMLVYPNGMAKMVEPLNDGLVGNYLKFKSTGLDNNGIYYHDGLKEYEFQMEDKPVFANDRYRLGKAIQYVNSESFTDYVDGINDGYQSNIIPAQDPQFYTYALTHAQDNTEYGPVVNTYEHNTLNSNADLYSHGYNREHSEFSNTQGWPLRNENLYERDLSPIANVNYEYNTAAVTDHQYLLPSENIIAEGNVQYTPSLDNTYDNSNLVGYNTNTNQYEANENDDYAQQNYEVPANHNYQYSDATGRSVGVSTQNHNDYSYVNTQNILHNHNLNSATSIQQNNNKQTAASGKPTV